jgi:hypothetical protein
MKLLLSKWGAGVFVVYLLAGIVILRYEKESRPRCWMMCDFFSGILSLPALLPVSFILNLAGCRNCTMDAYRPLFIFLSAVIFYLLAALVEAWLRHR